MSAEERGSLWEEFRSKVRIAMDALSRIYDQGEQCPLQGWMATYFAAQFGIAQVEIGDAIEVVGKITAGDWPAVMDDESFTV